MPNYETVFLEFIFRPIEQLIEGGPAQRQRLDKAPWNLEKIFKKGLKLTIYAALAWVIASTALAYFIGREPLLQMMTESPAQNLGLFVLTLVFLGIMMFQFGWFREQFCTVLCPYARFQSVLMDAHSLTVGYDYQRGEPRGKKEDGAGDCIDCGLCVRVCPTGIDIRNGIQLECIQCTACADACDSVMEKLGRPLGLVRYSTEDELKGNNKKFLRPRVIIYGGILSLYLCLFAYTLFTRKSGDFQIIRGTIPFEVLADGKIVNRLKIHIGNKAKEKDVFFIDSISNTEVSYITPIKEVEIESGELKTIPIFFTFSPTILKDGSLELNVILKSKSGFSGEQKISLLGSR